MPHPLNLGKKNGIHKDRLCRSVHPRSTTQKHTKNLSQRQLQGTEGDSPSHRRSTVDHKNTTDKLSHSFTSTHSNHCQPGYDLHSYKANGPMHSQKCTSITPYHQSVHHLLPNCWKARAHADVLLLMHASSLSLQSTCFYFVLNPVCVCELYPTDVSVELEHRTVIYMHCAPLLVKATLPPLYLAE